MRLLNDIESITSAAQAKMNINKFTQELKKSPALQKRLKRVHSWYVHKLRNGEIIFGSSKFIGYQDLTAGEYIKYATVMGGLDGKETLKTLEPWFTEIEDDTSEYDHLKAKLETYLEKFGKTPRKSVKIFMIDDQRDQVIAKSIIPRNNSDAIVRLILEVAKNLPSSSLRQLTDQLVK